MKNRKSQKVFVKKVVNDTINILLVQANKNIDSHPSRAKRYVEMLWALVKKYKIRLTKDQKTKFCRKCQTFFAMDKTAKVIFNSKHTSFYLQCMKCWYKRRI